MIQLTASPPPAAAPSTVEPSPVNASNARAPYIAPQLLAHEAWVLTTGVSFRHDEFSAEFLEGSS